MLIDMIIFFAIMLVAVFLLTDILQLFISLRYKPYIEYPVKDVGLAVVYFYQLARGGKGNYSGYKFITRNEKWRYRFTRSDLIGLVSFFTIFVLAFVLTMITKGLPSLDLVIRISLFCLAVMIGIVFYFPLRSYMFLKKDIRKRQR